MKNYMMLSTRTSAAHRLLFYLAIVLIILIRTVAFFYLQKIERNDFKSILPTHPNSGSLKGRCDRNLILTGEMMIVMKMKSHISLTTKNLTQTEIRKTGVDFMTIKIRSPTQKTMQLNNLTLGDV